MNFQNKLYIAVEGVDGSGKTTTIKQITRKLKRHGISCLTTKEPHSLIKPTGDNREDIKKYAKDRLNWQKNHFTNADIILQDRSLYSSYANQVTNEDEKSCWIHENKSVIRPDILIFLNPSLKLCQKNDTHKNDKHTLKELKIQHQRYMEILPNDTWYINTVSNLEKNYIIDMVLDEYYHMR